DGRDAHHDDQGQHDRVLDRRRAVFPLEEIHQSLSDLPHAILLSVTWRSAGLFSATADPWFCAPALRRVCRFEDVRTLFPNPRGAFLSQTVDQKLRLVKSCPIFSEESLPPAHPAPARP